MSARFIFYMSAVFDSRVTSVVLTQGMSKREDCAQMS